MADDVAGDMTRETVEAAPVPAAERTTGTEPVAEQAPGSRPDISSDQPDIASDRRPNHIGTGPGRLLLSLYAVFTVAALSRSIVQISTKYHDAPLAYLLSGVAGVVYAVITFALWRGGDSARKVALVCCSAELVGVLTVGVATLVDSSAFPDATVWSSFGIGYAFLPLALPVAGLLWLRRAAREAGARPQQTGD